MLGRAALAACVLLAWGGPAAAGGWPDLADAGPKIGGGNNDAAVIVGIEDYAFVADIPGAQDNAKAWYAWLTRARGVPPAKVTLLRDEEGTRENLAHFASVAAGAVGEGGTLWFVFIGHGAPAPDGSDGLLIGADAQQTIRSLAARGIPRAELLATLGKGAQARTVMVVDACFSGRTPEGKPLAPGLQPLVAVKATPPEGAPIVMSAGRSDQFAGPLPGAERPAFSYLLLGALRGWGDRDGDGSVTAGEAVAYATDALRALVKDRSQTPELSGPDDALTGGAREAGPDLTAMVLGGGTDDPAGPTNNWKTRGKVIVRITSDPPGALVSMGRHEASAPFEASFRPGSYELTFTKPYHEPLTMPLKVGRRDKTLTLHGELKSTVGVVDVVVSPHDARVAIDGQDRGKGSMRLEQLSVGAHELRVEHPSYYAEAVSLAVEAGERKEISVELKPKMGLLEVRAKHRDGEVATRDVRIDGRRVGKTPWKGEVVMGRRRVSVGQMADVYVEVPENAEAPPVEVTLETTSGKKKGASWGPLGWVGLATAGAGAVAGLLFLQKATATTEEIESGKSSGMTQSEAFEKQDSVDRDNLIALVGLGVGVAGLTLFVIDWATYGDDTTVSVVPTGDGQGGLVTLQGGF